MRERPRRAVAAIELTATVLPAFAAVSTAWCGYQATRWNGEQAKAAAAASATRFQPARASDPANAQTQVDVATFVAWADAYAHDDKQLVDFYQARFRAEFKPAVDAWVATRPSENSAAPLTPFAMPEYNLASAADADRLDKQAVLAATVRQYLQRASNYVLGVVLCSVALFFGGVSTKLVSSALRVATVSIGCLVFLGTLVWLASFPVSWPSSVRSGPRGRPASWPARARPARCPAAGAQPQRCV
jgi:hypothetical protein